jgi:predicted ATP-grasp superfamily ATP-dependent carboligase
MNNNKKKLVLVLGASATALAIVRELQNFEKLDIVVAAQGTGPASVSKYLFDNWCINNLDDLIKKIQKQAVSHEIALIPSSDLFVEWICKNSKQLNSYCAFDGCYHTGLALKYLDKDIFSQIINKNGMQQPKVDDVMTFDKCHNDQKYFPVFIKPKIIHQKKDSIPGQKGMIVKHLHDWQQWLTKHDSDSDDWIVQEIIMGSEDNIMLYVGYINNKGEITTAYCARKIRQYPPGFGSASLVLSEDNDAISEISAELLKKTHYRGVCSGEFKWCPKRKKWVVIEFNPRPALWYYSAVASGRLIVSQAMANLLDLEVPKGNSTNGLTLWRYGLKDVFSRLFYFRHKDFILPAPNETPHLIAKKINKVYPVFTYDDMRPFFKELLTYASKGFSRIFK